MRVSTNHQGGFAMMEVLVTAIVFAIGVAGSGVLLLKTVQGTQDNAQRSQGMWIVQDLVGRMRSNANGAKSGDYIVEADKTYCSDNMPTSFCADHINSSKTFVSASSCDTTQMARFDIWLSLCGFDNNGGGSAMSSSSEKVFDSPAEFLINPELSSTCDLLIDNQCQRYTVALTWSTKITQGAEDEEDRINESSYSMTLELN